jgi:light-regulated signal transduction histidine kinase (bacteriophytochrome)
MRFLANLASFISGLSSSNIALARMQHELVRSNEQLRQFTYVASHDLQEPLRMVSTYISLLEKKYNGNLDGRAREYMEYAIEGSLRAKELISDLLEYTRMDGAEVYYGPVDMNEVVRQTLRDLEVPIHEAQAIIEISHLPMVYANEHQMRLVMRNLVSNAVKFRGQEAPMIGVSASWSGREWVFSVQDNGIGFNPEYADKIFLVFQRLHGREKYPGTGIGLAICKKIVERHGGRIWVESGKGKGSTFFFSLPKRGPR